MIREAPNDTIHKSNRKLKRHRRTQFTMNDSKDNQNVYWIPTRDFVDLSPYQCQTAALHATDLLDTKCCTAHTYLWRIPAPQNSGCEMRVETYRIEFRLLTRRTKYLFGYKNHVWRKNLNANVGYVTLNSISTNSINNLRWSIHEMKMTRLHAAWWQVTQNYAPPSTFCHARISSFSISHSHSGLRSSSISFGCSAPRILLKLHADLLYRRPTFVQECIREI